MTTYSPFDPERPSAYYLDDGRIGFRASELGRCPRAIVLALQGKQSEKPSEKGIRHMARGSRNEPWAAHWFEQEHGGKMQRQVQMNFEFENYIVGGVADAIWWPDLLDETASLAYHRIQKNNSIYDPETRIYDEYPLEFEPTAIFGAEIKCPDEHQFELQLRNGPNEIYRWQMSIYWAAMEQKLGVQLNGFAFIMFNDHREHVEFFDRPFYSVEDIKNRVRMLADLSQMDYKTIDCSGDFFCRYWRFHNNEIPPGTKKADKEKWDSAISGPALEYYRTCTEIEKLEAKKNSIKQDLEMAMRDRQSIKTQGFTVYKQGRDWVDKNGLEEYLRQWRPDLINQFMAFDADKFLKSTNEFTEQFTRSGRPYIVVRAIKSKLAAEDQRQPVEVRVDPNSLSDEDQDDLVSEILGEMGEMF